MAIITTTEDPTGKTTEIPIANGTTPKDNNMMVTKTDTTETLPPMKTRKSGIFGMASSKTKEEQDRLSGQMYNTKKLPKPYQQISYYS